MLLTHYCLVSRRKTYNPSFVKRLGLFVHYTTARNLFAILSKTRTLQDYRPTTRAIGLLNECRALNQVTDAFADNCSRLIVTITRFNHFCYYKTSYTVYV